MYVIKPHYVLLIRSVKINVFILALGLNILPMMFSWFFPFCQLSMDISIVVTVLCT